MEISRIMMLTLFILSTIKVAAQTKEAACGIRKINNFVRSRIAYGEKASPGEFPWFVSITIKKTAGQIAGCGGALIDTKWILTAAHCFDGTRNDLPMEDIIRDMLIVVGDTDLIQDEGTEQYPKAKNVFLHPKYIKIEESDDIALIELTSSVTINNYVSVVCLPQQKENVDNLKCTAAGVGLMNTTNQPLHLMKAVLPPITNEECNRITGHKFKPGILCAGFNSPGRPSICEGDSGGPFLCQKNNQWIVAGITSWAIGKCSKGERPSGFTRVSEYLNWIKKTMTSESVEKKIDSVNGVIKSKRQLLFLLCTSLSMSLFLVSIF